jgi:hypothetical protein
MVAGRVAQEVCAKLGTKDVRNKRIPSIISNLSLSVLMLRKGVELMLYMPSLERSDIDLVSFM